MPRSALIDSLMAKQKKTYKIGIIRGMETTFPDTLIPFINETYGSKGVTADFVMLDALKMNDDYGYDVIIDRISHEVPFYRSFLKHQALKGTYIVNNPFWWSADDKFIDNTIAEEAGVAVPKTVLLPHKHRPPNTHGTSFRNMKFVDWDAVEDYVGYPAFMKPFDGGGWRGVTRVTNREELMRAYDDSGDDCMMLQEGIEYEAYYRCYGVGQDNVHIMPYNPAAEPHRRYFDIPETHDDAILENVRTGVKAICKALGYDLNTVEFAVRDGIPYAIDFMNPAPDADFHSVGQEN
ncbi:MAG: hypothetical protein AAF752_15785, partial [Bacteroidota bacterium]